MSWNSKNLKICSKCPLGGARPPFWDPYIEKCLDGHIFGRTPVQIRLWDARNWFQLRSQYVFPFRALMGLGRLAIRGHFISWRLDWSNDYPHLNFLGKKVAIFHADSELGLKNDFGNIPRPLEAILSFKSLFEGVPESTLGSYFVWRAKMRNHYHLETSLEAVRPLLKFEAALVTSDLLDPHIWYSNDFPWSQDVKFDLGLGWPQATSSDLGISNSLYSLKKGPMKTGT